MRDRVRLHRVVLAGPVLSGVPGAALAGGIDRDVGTAGQDRADIVVDEDLLLADRIRQVEAALAGAVVAAVGDLCHFDLHHLADLLGQRHAAEQTGPPALNGNLAAQDPGPARPAPPWPELS